MKIPFSPPDITEAAAGHDLLERGENRGKVVLAI